MGVYYIGSIPCSGGDIYHFGRKGMKWGKNIFGKISEFFTGNNTRRELSSARTALRGAQQKSRHFDGKDINGNYAFDIRKDYNNPINISGRTYYPFEETGKRWSPEINRQNDRLNKAQADYDRTLPGMMAKAREKVSKAYSDAASALSGKGLDIQSFYSQVMQKAQGAINAGKNMVSKYGGQFVSQIQTLGNNALAGGKAFLDKAMEGARNAGRQIGEAAGNAREHVRNAGRQIGEAAGNAREFVTGEKARKKRDRDRSIYEKNSAAYEQEQSKKTKSPWSASHKSVVDKSKKRADESQAEYERTLPGMIERTARDAGEAISRRTRKARNDTRAFTRGTRARAELEMIPTTGRNRDKHREALEEYNRTLPGMAEQVRGKAASGIETIKRKTKRR